MKSRNRLLIIFVIVLQIVACSHAQHISTSTVQAQAISPKPLDRRQICENINNSYECAQAVEKVELEKWKAFARRDGRILYLQLKNGKEISYESASDLDDSHGTWYSLSSFNPETEIFLIEVQFYEGGRLEFVSRETGKSIALDSEPIFSPDKTHFATISGDDISSDFPARITIVNMDAGYFKREWKLEPKDWVPIGLKWESNNEIEIQKGSVEVDYNQGRHDFGAIKFINKNKSWIQKTSE